MNSRDPFAVTPAVAGAEAGDVSDPEQEKQLDPDDPSGGTRITTSTRTSAETRRFERREAVRVIVPEECYSGFIIVRLTDKIGRRDEACAAPGQRRGKMREDETPGTPGRGGEDFPGAWERFPLLWLKFPQLCGQPSGGPDHPAPDPCLDDPAFECLKALIRDCPPTRVVRLLAPEAILALEELAARQGPAPLHSLAAYWRIDARHLPDRVVRALVRLLNEFPEVDLAYRELAAFDPQDEGDTPSFRDLQQYRDGAPLGIGARWCWKRASEAGEAPSVVLADLEQGWLEHEDLPGPAEPVHGVNRHGRGGYRGDHGTAVIGQLAAGDDGRGVAGIVPGSRVLRLSHYQEGEGEAAPANGHVADAVVAAILELSFDPDVAARLRGGDAGDLRLEPEHLASPGNLLLLEVQRSFKPTEVDHADFDALRLAAALGVIVVEAAGNGRADLDAYVDETGRRILDPEDPEFRDSGAVLVGASESELPHNRASSSNFGARVDCFAWGRDVVTCGYGDLFDGGAGGDGKRRSYTRTFEGTSAAAPIVAGAAALLQWLHEQSGARLDSPGMRRALSNSATGTPQGREVPGAIGVMPDLRAIVHDLGLLPEFSPARALEVDEDAVAETPRVKVTARGGRAYLELTNQGLPLAKRAGGESNVEVDVYWSELSTLTTPDMWRKLDVPLAFNEDFPTGMPVELLVDAKDLRAPIRPEDYKGFLALPRRPGEPGPAIPPAWPYFDWEAFVGFQRRHGTSVTLVYDLGGSPPDVLELPFLVAGASDGPRLFDLEISQRLPMGAEVSWEVPAVLAAELREGRLSRRDGRFVLPARPRVSLSGLRLAAAGSWADPDEKDVGRHRCAFRVHGPRAGLGLTIRQLFRGEEVGRIRWELESAGDG